MSRGASFLGGVERSPCVHPLMGMVRPVHQNTQRGKDGTYKCEGFGNALVKRHSIELEGSAGAPAAGRALEQNKEGIAISMVLCLKGTGIQAMYGAVPHKPPPHGRLWTQCHQRRHPTPGPTIPLPKLERRDNNKLSGACGREGEHGRDMRP